MNSPLRLALCLGGLIFAPFLAHAQTSAPLERIADPAVWRVSHRTAKLVPHDGSKAVHLDAKANAGFAWLVGSEFTDGTIEVDLRGRDVNGQSFVGLAFRGVNDTTYDAVYFRPFNFKNVEVERRARAVQYVSVPTHDWPKLRADSPGKYEAAVAPVPEPNDWFHARVVVADRKVSVYVNHAATPCLVVNELSERRGGAVGLWVGNGSEGTFANLKIQPRTK